MVVVPLNIMIRQMSFPYVIAPAYYTLPYPLVIIAHKGKRTSHVDVINMIVLESYEFFYSKSFRELQTGS